ncbi:RNA polymerase sigma factor [Alkalicella caledoniensis]|uniref:RNA polymerase sigma factor n=1 Tax=Alkalicella caledoniensis TaxID=2731377 RepID=A0A7G9WAB6_ALKCA|nr:RNA polymerase sigma factor [Alkalicella caledoniensis]QNO15628.1 RNA polymerase sigma factor [Alkalicella caledoniensis]
MREELLIESFKRGDESAFIEIYELYFQEVYNFVAYSVNGDVREDITQDIFMKVYKSMRKFKGKCSIKTWVFNIAKRTIYDWYRLKKNVFNIDDYESLLTERDTPEKVFEKKERISFLVQGLNDLKEDHKMVILLRKFHGFSIKETSNIMGYSEGKIKTILHRGLKALKENLENDYFQEGGQNLNEKM